MKNKERFSIFIRVRNKSDMIMVSSALKRVGMSNWHDPYEGHDTIAYAFWDHPIKCIRLYFMLCRTCKVMFGRNY